jgi:hypothetical protein
MDNKIDLIRPSSRLPMQPAFMSHVISFPYLPRASSIREIHTMGGWDGRNVRLTGRNRVDFFGIDHESWEEIKSRGIFSATLNNL